MNRLYAVLVILSAAVFIIACSTVIPQPTEDTSYLTPIPEATRIAFKYDRPATNKLEAAIFALGRSEGGHFGFTKLPIVVSVEKLNINEAHNRLGDSTFDDKGWSTDVWFVVLEGEIQIIPPPPPPGVTATPWTPFHGCNYVIFDANNPEEYGSMGGYPCPTKTP